MNDLLERVKADKKVLEEKILKEIKVFESIWGTGSVDEINLIKESYRSAIDLKLESKNIGVSVEIKII